MKTFATFKYFCLKRFPVNFWSRHDRGFLNVKRGVFLYLVEVHKGKVCSDFATDLTTKSWKVLDFHDALWFMYRKIWKLFNYYFTWICCHSVKNKLKNKCTKTSSSHRFLSHCCQQNCSYFIFNYELVIIYYAVKKPQNEMKAITVLLALKQIYCPAVSNCISLFDDSKVI